ncbi:pyruvate kinase [Robertkochia flava]|uniref:pyruvate kinase n=1 Tax=Robertkochia flava TaxID=3447986 RepID=UPI001CCD24CF|nr:pyruvate kinase [Robertkochia marina]
MQTDTKTIKGAIARLEEIIAQLNREVDAQESLLNRVHPGFRESAVNLIHYVTFRRFNLTRLQGILRNMGITGFSHAEGQVMSTLLHSRHLLQCLLETKGPCDAGAAISVERSRQLLREHTISLMGCETSGRRVGIMVTQPTESAWHPELVREMIRAGMDCARINCAHDDKGVWMKIINNVRTEAEQAGKKVTITMDLAGPKIRTGALEAGMRVRKFSPKKDEGGHVLKPATVMLKRTLSEDGPSNTLPVSVRLLESLKVGDKVFFRDERDKKRELVVAEVMPGLVKTYLYKTSYIRTGTALHKADGLVSDVGELPRAERPLLLKKGQFLKVTGPDTAGRSSVKSWDGATTQPAQIPCQMPEVFTYLKPGERVLFDDGKIEGVIREAAEDGFLAEITRAREKGSWLRSEKGINFPDSRLKVKGLTAKDREDLRFIVSHADVVNFSFVNSGEDVEELLDALNMLGVSDNLGIILKIETGAAYDNLYEILTTAMRRRNIGVMIARGDLAVETGWEHMGLVQEEILAMCGAAHVPVIWATQVLENLAKKGLPSRSEITDATNSLKAECVMLNKGPYITDAIRLLDSILRESEKFRLKKERMLPRIE